MTLFGRRDEPKDEQGAVLPTRLLALSVSAIAAAALVYVANDPNAAPSDRATPTVTRPTTTPTPTPSVAPTTKRPSKPKPIRRGSTNVDIYNNTRVKGLAGRTAATATAAGWKVIGTQNWVGTVDATTVYYPPALKSAAGALARDLGIKRVKLAEDPMKMDRITVILTDGYTG